MSGRYAILLCLLLIAPVRAEVFTWTDAAGVRHYGDRPPADTTAEALELDRQALSTIGDSGIRPGERELLERAETMEAARLQAAATRAAARPPVTRLEIAPSPATERHVVYHRPLPHRAYHKPRKIHWGFDLNLGRLSIRAGRPVSVPPHRSGYRPPHAYRPPVTHRTGPSHRTPGSARPTPARLRPPTH